MDKIIRQCYLLMGLMLLPWVYPIARFIGRVL
jgi:hypothetical protein